MRIIKLSKQRKNQIEKWLRFLPSTQVRSCPFTICIADSCVSICLPAFPKLRKTKDLDHDTVDRCPCSAYTLAHIERTARKMLEN